ncbi:hypothetical protein BKA69DRAFT_1080258 [Paraphysoderma sedebokerense]|nr:hypothetical protein BKA69DRAFT_1080258 [Paraphysoderma sedebokerense]
MSSQPSLNDSQTMPMSTPMGSQTPDDSSQISHLDEPPNNSQNPSSTPSRPIPSDSANGALCKWANCNITFSALHELVNHLADVHIGNRKGHYACEWEGCSRYGVNQSSRFALIAHMRSHTGEKPYDCPIPECDKSFSRSDALAKHVKVQHRDYSFINGKYEYVGLPPGETAVAPNSRKRKNSSHPSGATPPSKKNRKKEKDVVKVEPGVEQGVGEENEIQVSQGVVAEDNGDVTSDEEVHTLPTFKDKYRVMKERYRYMKSEVGALEGEYETAKKTLRRLQIAKEILLDSLIEQEQNVHIA